MAIDFEIREHVVHVTVDRAGTEAELRDAIARVREHPDYLPGCDVLVDVRGIAEVPESSDLADTGRMVAREAERVFSRVAFVASGPLQFGLTRMFGLYVETGRLEVRVFQNEPAARQWLGLAP